MKESTKRNIILIIVIQFLTIIVLLIGTCSCSIYDYTPNVLKPNGVYEQWKAEQKAANDALYRYTQSEAYQKKYYGKNPAQHTDSPAANSVVGTKDDPLVNVRNSNNIPSSVSTQNYRITFR
jgi:uncharacterized protein YxeA